MKLEYSRTSIARGAVIYSSGDLIASLLVHEFSWFRLAGMAVIGATIYALEIPNYFKYIERITAAWRGTSMRAMKTLLALLYFNPLWITRHLVLISLFSGTAATLTPEILKVATFSFLANIPISILANYLIQNKVTLAWRFFASALFSAAMAVYYALSPLLFR